jgi:hypothetical protein
VRHNTIFYLWFFFHHFSGGFNIANTTVDQKPSTGSGFIFQSGTKPASHKSFSDDLKQIYGPFVEVISFLYQHVSRQSKKK